MELAEVQRLFARATTPGTRLRLLTTTHVARDEYDVEVLENGARAIRVIHPKLPHDAFVARFGEDALRVGPAVLALSQTNPVGAPGDGECLETVDGQRVFRFGRTTPPFLLPLEVSEELQDGNALNFGFADERLGGPLFIDYFEDDRLTLRIDDAEVPVRSIHYREHEGEPRASLTVLASTPLVLAIEREAWSTKLISIHTPTPEIREPKPRGRAAPGSLIVRVVDSHPTLNLTHMEMPFDQDYFWIGRADGNDIVVRGASDLTVAKKAMHFYRGHGGELSVTHGGSLHRIFVRAADGVHEVGPSERTRSIALGERVELYSVQGALALAMELAEASA